MITRNTENTCKDKNEQQRKATCIHGVTRHCLVRETWSVVVGGLNFSGSNHSTLYLRHSSRYYRLYICLKITCKIVNN